MMKKSLVQLALNPFLHGNSKTRTQILDTQTVVNKNYSNLLDDHVHDVRVDGLDHDVHGEVEHLDD